MKHFLLTPRKCGKRNRAEALCALHSASVDVQKKFHLLNWEMAYLLRLQAAAHEKLSKQNAEDPS